MKIQSVVTHAIQNYVLYTTKKMQNAALRGTKRKKEITQVCSSDPEVFDCCCPQTCTNATLDQRFVKGMTYRERIRLIQTKYGSSHGEACIVASNENPRLGNACNPELCSTIEKANFTQYYYLHIPKAGGTSMQASLSKNGAWVFNIGMGPNVLDIKAKMINFPGHRVFMTEGIGFRENPVPHSLTMFRDPMDHVVSMYFHCREARIRKKNDNKLDIPFRQWLQHFDNIQTLSKSPHYYAKRGFSYWRDHLHKCYVPINFQSYFVGEPIAKTSLQNKFEVIGLLEHYDQSTCLMLIHMLKKVLDFCNCTLEKRKEAIPERKRIVRHGVSNYKEKFEITKEKKLINSLTKRDKGLYWIAKEIFQEQIQNVQRQYEFKLCL